MNLIINRIILLIVAIIWAIMSLNTEGTEKAIYVVGTGLLVFNNTIRRENEHKSTKTN